MEQPGPHHVLQVAPNRRALEMGDQGFCLAGLCTFQLALSFLLIL